jgi:uroporphyrin-III C-methyltransferase
MGKVYLIGAGPGAADLLTLRAVRTLAAADVVLVDELVAGEVLEHVRPGARIVRVGKRAGCRSTPQAFIQRLAARYARQGRAVARLKGGDPFVFGRGGEEIEYLRAQGVTVEVIPGVTAGTAVPATLGIPVTHRAFTHGVTFVTGHTRDDAGPDWGALAASGTTLVIYMGLRRLGAIVRALLAAGMDPATPAAAIAHGTLAHQREVVSTLAGLPAEVAFARLEAPALIVVGEVVSLAAIARDAGEALAA